jgi:hypothetical protein
MGCLGKGIRLGLLLACAAIVMAMLRGKDPCPVPASCEPAIAGFEDSAPAPGFPILTRGEEVLLSHGQGLEVVTIIGHDSPIGLASPTRARAVDGRPKRQGALVGLYEVEVLEGEYRGRTGMAHPRNMRMGPPVAGLIARRGRGPSTGK